MYKIEIKQLKIRDKIFITKSQNITDHLLWRKVVCRVIKLQNMIEMMRESEIWIENLSVIGRRGWWRLH